MRAIVWGSLPILAFVAWMLGCEGMAGLSTGQVEGRVTDMTGTPLGGVKVRVLEIEHKQAISDSRGHYKIPDLAPGRYRIQASRAGYVTATEPAEVGAGRVTVVNFTLRAPPRSPEPAEALEESRGGSLPAPSLERFSPQKMEAHPARGLSAPLPAPPAHSAPESRFLPAHPMATSVPNSSSPRSGFLSRQDDRLLPGVGGQAFSREGYDLILENPFLSPRVEPLSTFSIDVDTAAYANVRRFIEREHQRPPRDAVRIEELLNYFTYDYPDASGAEPFSVTTEVSEAPWNRAHRLLHIGIQGRKVAVDDLPPSNLVFLLDVSGSMNSPDKLPLLKAAFRLLVNQLRPQDRVAIVVYAGAAGLVLPSTPGLEKDRILAAIDTLQAGGSTAGGAGIQLAYQVAAKHFLTGGNNRVLLATDGDFNIGISSDGALVRLIEKNRAQGVFLTVLGVGRGNYQDAKMEKLSNAGNGNAAYIDSLLEAKKVLVTEMGGTLLTIAKDVKIQIEFNPSKVKGYRLIGYENRMLRAQDFIDDQKDAGELGAGHSVTALYEIIPAGSQETVPGVEDLKYQTADLRAAAGSEELLTLKLRYKEPDADKSRQIVRTVIDTQNPPTQTSIDFRFSAAVAEFGLLLRDSPYQGQASFEQVLAQAKAARGRDEGGYRRQFIELVEQAAQLEKR